MLSRDELKTLLKRRENVRHNGGEEEDTQRRKINGNLADDEFEFLLAMEVYKHVNGSKFPSWTECLWVMKQLGYEKKAESNVVARPDWVKNIASR